MTAAPENPAGERRLQSAATAVTALASAHQRTTLNPQLLQQMDRTLRRMAGGQ